eukprot:TRINITY_DN5482_c0_g2_i1.p1 TRINITY_DN5482_c0_g2~~TRINITY_DN5482_c0_g2_i1.p1  ORF type:complete len:731 (+),score=95.60 TRINITY_DN5482_c0_g2_i1:80-2272(+)
MSDQPSLALIEISPSDSHVGFDCVWTVPTTTVVVDGTANPFCSSVSSNQPVSTVSPTEPRKSGRTKPHTRNHLVRPTKPSHVEPPSASQAAEDKCAVGFDCVWTAPTSTAVVDGTANPFCTSVLPNQPVSAAVSPTEPRKPGRAKLRARKHLTSPIKPSNIEPPSETCASEAAEGGSWVYPSFPTTESMPAVPLAPQAFISDAFEFLRLIEAQDVEGTRLLLQRYNDIPQYIMVMTISRVLSYRPFNLALLELLPLYGNLVPEHSSLFLAGYRKERTDMSSLAELLLNNLDFDEQDEWAKAIAEVAIKKRDTEMMETLLCQGFPYALPENILVRPDLIYDPPNREFMDVLIQHGYIDDPVHNWTPLQTAVRVGNLEMFKYLLDCGADINALTCDGESVSSMMQVFHRGNWRREPFAAKLPYHRVLTLFKVVRPLRTVWLDGVAVELLCDVYKSLWCGSQRSVSFSPNERFALVRCDGICKIYERTSDESCYAYRCCEDLGSTQLRRIANDGETTAHDVIPRSGTSGGFVVPLGATVRLSERKHSLAVTGFAFGADQTYVYSIHTAATACRTNIATGECTMLPLSYEAITAALSPRGDYVLVASERRISAIRTCDWKVMRLIGIPFGRVYALSRDCRFVHVKALLDTSTDKADSDNPEDFIYEIPATLGADWSPERHHGFPLEFRSIVRCVLMCALCDAHTNVPLYPQCGLWTLPVDVLHEVFAHLAVYYI